MTPLRMLVRATPAPDGSTVTLYLHRVNLREVSMLVAGGGPLDVVKVRRTVVLEVDPPILRMRGGLEVDRSRDPWRFPIPPGHVMIVDDTGRIDGKPRNALGSQVYAAQCRPGAVPDLYIAGDVFICPDEDFA